MCCTAIVLILLTTDISNVSSLTWKKVKTVYKSLKETYKELRENFFGPDKYNNAYMVYTEPVLAPDLDKNVQSIKILFVTFLFYLTNSLVMSDNVADDNVLWKGMLDLKNIDVRHWTEMGRISKDEYEIVTKRLRLLLIIGCRRIIELRDGRNILESEAQERGRHLQALILGFPFVMEQLEEDDTRETLYKLATKHENFVSTRIIHERIVTFLDFLDREASKWDETEELLHVGKELVNIRTSDETPAVPNDSESYVSTVTEIRETATLVLWRFITRYDYFVKKFPKPGHNEFDYKRKKKELERLTLRSYAALIGKTVNSGFEMKFLMSATGTVHIGEIVWAMVQHFQTVKTNDVYKLIEELSKLYCATGELHEWRRKQAHKSAAKVLSQSGESLIAKSRTYGHYGMTVIARMHYYETQALRDLVDCCKTITENPRLLQNKGEQLKELFREHVAQVAILSCDGMRQIKKIIGVDYIGDIVELNYREVVNENREISTIYRSATTEETAGKTDTGNRGGTQAAESTQSKKGKPKERRLKKTRNFLSIFRLFGRSE